MVASRSKVPPAVQAQRGLNAALAGTAYDPGMTLKAEMLVLTVLIALIVVLAPHLEGLTLSGIFH